MELLASRGAVVSYSDDLVPSVRVGDTTLRSVARNQIASADADLVAVLVGGDWPLAALAQHKVTVFDAVNDGGATDLGSPGGLRRRL
jgi:hypothetical protein